MDDNKQQSPNLRMPVDSCKKDDLADNLRRLSNFDITNMVRCSILSKQQSNGRNSLIQPFYS